MRTFLLFLTFAALVVNYDLHQAHAAPAGPLIKHLSSLVKWTRSSAKTPHSDGNVLQFEDGYLVETVVEGNELGVVPHSIRVSQDGELFAVDAVNSNIVRITPPLSQYSRARLVAGSFQGYTGHVDGKPSDARFNRPKGVTMDDKGNVYVADTLNLAIRKIGESGVTTIAGGKSNVAGYRDGPSEYAKFSNDFDLVYVKPTCSLLVIDRGNAALRQISLNQEDCDYQYSSISPADVIMAIGAVLLGYASCMIQQGFGPSFFSRTHQPSESEFEDQLSEEKPTPIVESIKEEPVAGWPSFGQLIIDLSKLALEALGNIFLYFIPSRSRSRSSKKGLTPLKDSLRIPEDEAEPPLVQKQGAPAPLPETGLQARSAPAPLPETGLQAHRAPAPLPETGLQAHRAPASLFETGLQAHRTPAPLFETGLQAHTPTASDSYAEMKPSKIKSASFKDPSLSSKHRSSKRQEYAEFYGSGEVPPYSQSRSKSHKERTRHRSRDKSGEVIFGAVGAESKPVENKAADYDDQKFDRYNFRSKYASDRF